jgi:thioesterase-3
MTAHKIKIKVRGYHLDMYQHVNNARYLEFLEEARWDYVESVIPLDELIQDGFGFAVVNININYRNPAFINQTIEIHSHMATISRRSATIHQQILVENSSKKIADADVTFVIIDIKTGKSIPLEGKIRTILEKF